MNAIQACMCPFVCPCGDASEACLSSFQNDIVPALLSKQNLWQIVLYLKVFQCSVCSDCMCVWKNMEDVPAFISRSVLVVKPACCTWSCTAAVFDDTDICPGS